MSMRVVVAVSLLTTAYLIACPQLRHATAGPLSSATQACTMDDVQYVYTDCLHRGNTTTTTSPSILGVPFFDPSTCDANASGSVSLPGLVHTACDFACDPGFAIGTNGLCDPCPRGSYSAGDALDIFAGAPSTFEDMAEKGAWTTCMYMTSKSRSFDARCSGWTIEDGILTVGPYDTPNSYYASKCKSSNITCVNNVQSELRLDVKLVKNGSVVFDYDVDAESGYDGLKFYIDNFAPEGFNFTSTTTSTQTFEVALAKGRHSLSWVFTKDSAFTGGKDMAWIRRLIVYGAEETTKTCVACPRMTSTAGIGSDMCEPCAPDQIWQVNTASSAIASGLCSNCPENYHPNEERSACVQSPECGPDDMTTKYAGCDASGKRMKSFVWKDKLSCRVTSSLPDGYLEDCPACPEGYIFETLFNGTATSCKRCSKGRFRSATSETDECQLCEPGKYALPSFRIDRFDRIGLDDPLITDHFSFFCDVSSENERIQCLRKPISIDGDGALVIDATVSPQVYVDFHLRMIPNLLPDDAYLMLMFRNRMNKMDIYIDGTYTRARTSYDNGLYGYKVRLNGGQDIDVRLKWIFGSAPTESSDVRLQAIEARGERNGGAGSCDQIPPGSVALALSMNDDDDDEYSDEEEGDDREDEQSYGAVYYTGCQPGSYGEPNAITCLPCAPNTFSDSSGSTACTPCPSGTSSLAESSACVIGDLEKGNMTEVFCSYNDTESTDLYNLATLSAANNETGVFGPIYESGSSGSAFYLGICKQLNSTVCADYGGDIINTTVCKVSAYTSYRTKNKVGSGLGNAVAVYSLSEYDTPMSEVATSAPGRISAIKGLKMSISGGTCGFGTSAVPHVSNITFLCDLDVGAGWPSAWDAYTAYSLSIGKAPSHALSLSSQHLPISYSKKCNHEFLWYSKYACPVCTAADVEAVEVAGCPNRILRTYRLKASSTCIDLNNIVPKDDQCKPCQKADYARIEYRGCPEGKLSRYVLKSPVQCYVVDDAPADEMCRACTREDYDREEFEAGSCPRGLAAKWTPKLPKICWDVETPPPDEKCTPCTENDYEARPEACFDIYGGSNVTYAWISPKTCSELTGVLLPPPLVVGPCPSASSNSNVFRDPKVIASLAVGGVIIVMLICMVIRVYYKNRKLYAVYAKLVDDGGIANLEMVDDSTPANEHDLEDDEMPMF